MSTSNDTTKRCTKCSQEFPRTGEYFYTRKNPRYVGEVSPRCKSCTKQDVRAWNATVKDSDSFKQKNRDYYLKNSNPTFRRESKVIDGKKQCRRCKQWLLNSHDNFSFHPSNEGQTGFICKLCTKQVHISPDGMKYCPQCSTEYPSTREFFYRSQKLGLFGWCKSCTNQKARDARRANPQHFRAQDKKRAEKKRQYRRNNPNKIKALKQRRNARRNGLPANFTDQQWQSAKEWFGNNCAYCGCAAVLCMDHVIPLSNKNSSNPGTVATNIVPACRSCNSSKCDKPISEWLYQNTDRTTADNILSRIAEYFQWVINH